MFYKNEISRLQKSLLISFLDFFNCSINKIHFSIYSAQKGIIYATKYTIKKAPNHYNTLSLYKGAFKTKPPLKNYKTST
jgi:hypothetical protein